MNRPPQRQEDSLVDFELVDTLTRDVAAVCAALVSRPDQPGRRTAFRTAFAAVEGITYYFKQQALRDPDRYSPEELALLREEGYGLSLAGEVSVTFRRLPSVYNFFFAARMAIRPLQPDVVIDRRDPGLLAFTRSIQVRHRITHPKRLADLHITDDELRSLGEGLKWCYGLLIRFEEAVVAEMRKAQEEISEIVQEFKVSPEVEAIVLRAADRKSSSAHRPSGAGSNETLKRMPAKGRRQRSAPHR